MTNHMRHILLITNYFAPDGGAAAVRLTRLTHALQQMDYQLAVLTSMPHYPKGAIQDDYRGKFSVVEQRGNVRVIQTWLWATPSPKIALKLLSQLSFMITALLRGLFLKRSDIVLIEAQPIFASLVGVILAFWLRRPYVLNVSDLWPEHLLSVGVINEHHIIYRLARSIVNMTYRHAAGIVAMSPDWAKHLEQHIGQHPNLRVIYNSVDLQQFRPNLDSTTFRQNHQIPANHQVISFIGTFATQYDFQLMLDATEQLNRSDITVLFIGQGSQSEYVERRLQDASMQHVRWITWLPHDQMPLAWNISTLTFWAMRDHDLYAGTIPAKLYEAMACGIPMVMVGRGVSATILEESGAGIVIRDHSVTTLTKSVTTLLNDPHQLQALSDNGRRYAETHFDHVRVAESYLDVLNRALR